MISEFLVCFRSYLFARAPFAQTLRGSTGEGRPVTVVAVSARAARGVRSIFFCWREWLERFPQFSL